MSKEQAIVRGALYEPKKGDHVIATWTTKSGTVRRVRATVTDVTPKRVQVRYERTTRSGTGFHWRVCEPRLKRDQVRPSKKAPDTALPVIEAFIGIQAELASEKP